MLWALPASLRCRSVLLPSRAPPIWSRYEKQAYLFLAELRLSNMRHGIAITRNITLSQRLFQSLWKGLNGPIDAKLSLKPLRQIL